MKHRYIVEIEVDDHPLVSYDNTFYGLAEDLMETYGEKAVVYIVTDLAIETLLRGEELGSEG